MLAWQRPSLESKSLFFAAKIGYIPLLPWDVEPVTAPYESSAACRIYKTELNLQNCSIRKGLNLQNGAEPD